MCWCVPRLPGRVDSREAGSEGQEGVAPPTRHSGTARHRPCALSALLGGDAGELPRDKAISTHAPRGGVRVGRESLGTYLQASGVGLVGPSPGPANTASTMPHTGPAKARKMGGRGTGSPGKKVSPAVSACPRWQGTGTGTGTGLPVCGLFFSKCGETNHQKSVPKPMNPEFRVCPAEETVGLDMILL